jgi:anti-anti-sigma factor
MDSTLEILPLDGARGFRLFGELDLESASQLEGAFAGLQGSGPAHLDVSGLTFLDSSGLHTIAALARAQDGNGRLIVEGVSPSIRRLFEITGLTQHPSLDMKLSIDGD